MDSTFKDLIINDIISLGGWCGPGLSIRSSNLLNTSNHPSLPFDSIRCSIEGIIHSLKTDFVDFLPPVTLQSEVTAVAPFCFKWKSLGFYHHDMRLPEVRQAFERRITRFKDILRDSIVSKKRILFVRTVISTDPKDEIMRIDELINTISLVYKRLEFRLLVIIHGQKKIKTVRYNDKTMIKTFPINKYDTPQVINSYNNAISSVLQPNSWKNIPTIDDQFLKSLNNDDDLWIIEGNPCVGL